MARRADRTGVDFLEIKLGSEAEDVGVAVAIGWAVEESMDVVELELREVVHVPVQP